MKEQLNLQKVVSVKERQGLYLLKGYNSNGYHIQPLEGGPITTISNDKGRVLALGNVDLQLEEGSINLMEVFNRMNQQDMSLEGASDLRALFEQFIPNLSRTAVAESHLKKVWKWYQLLKLYIEAKQVVNVEDEGLTIV